MRQWSLSFPLRAASLLFLLLVAGRSFAATEVPFEFRDGVIWLKVAVPEKGTALNFVLDSGASVSVLDLRATRQLGLRLGEPRMVKGVHSESAGYNVTAFTGETGGIRLPHSLLALDLSAISAACSRTVDGLLGADFFRGRVVQIDFTRNRIRFLERGEMGATDGEALPIALRNDAMCVRVSVAGQPADWMRIDTGCNSALQWVANPSARRNRLASVRSMAADIQIGSRRMAVKTGVHSRPMFTGEAGLLGNGVLSKFSKVTFDMSGRRLLLAGERS